MWFSFQKHSSENQFFLPALILGLSLILGTFIAGNSFYQVKALNNNVSVVGSAEKLITSDTVKWIGSFSRTSGVDNLAAESRHMKQDLKTIKDYFISKGVSEEELTVDPVSVTPSCNNRDARVWDSNTGKETCMAGFLSGYSLQQRITVESNNVQEITALAQEGPNELIGKDIVFVSQNLEYYYSKLGELKLEMLSEATKNAQERAEHIAESTGAKIGKVQSASVGVFQIIQPNSTDFADYGRYDTSTIEKKIVSVVRAAFTLR